MNSKDLLKRRTRRPGAAARQRKKTKAVTPEKAAGDYHHDPLCRAFEGGPFPGAAVEPFPPAAVFLFERFTGRPFDPRAMAAWERIRAFTGYEGVDAEPLAIHQWLEDPHPVRSEMEPISAAPQSRQPRSIRTPAGGAAPGRKSPALPPMDLDAFDPNDLGD